MRVCTYNVLHFGPGSDQRHVDALRTVIGTIQPDLLAVQELNDEAGYTAFTERVIRTALPRMSAVPFNDGETSDNGIFYDSLKLRFISTEGFVVGRNLFDHAIFTVTATDEIIHLYVAHLQDGTDGDDVRAVETRAIHDLLCTLPPQSYYLLAGDLNVYGSGEEAYRNLLHAPDLCGELVDPVDSIPTWRGQQERYAIDSGYAINYTQSPRGGSNGGMDDRFDFILVSPALHEKSIPGSYRAFGNDGLHFNRALTDTPLVAGMSRELVQALHDASDHLPVVMELGLWLRAIERPVDEIGEIVWRDGEIVVEWREKMEDAHLVLYSVDGRRSLGPLNEQTGDLHRSSYRIAEGIPAGTYLVQIEQGGVVRSAGRVVIVR